MVSFGRSGFVFAALAAACVVGVPALAAGAAPGADSPQLDPIYVDGMAGGDGV